MSEVHRAAEDAGQVHHAGVRSVRGLPYLAGAAADGRSARRGEHSGVLADAGGGVQSGGAWGNVGGGMECLLNESRRGKGKERKGKEGGSEWMEEERKEEVNGWKRKGRREGVNGWKRKGRS